MGKKQLSDSTWKRYKRELAALGCPLHYNVKTKKLTVPKGWTLAPMSQMDPRKREILVRLRIDLLRMGSPFVETLGPLFERWESQLAGMDPTVKERLPVWQPQPRVNAAFYENLSACERAIQERRILGFTYKKSYDGTFRRGTSCRTISLITTVASMSGASKRAENARSSSPWTG